MGLLLRATAWAGSRFDLPTGTWSVTEEDRRHTFSLTIGAAHHMSWSYAEHSRDAHTITAEGTYHNDAAKQGDFFGIFTVAHTDWHGGHAPPPDAAVSLLGVRVAPQVRVPYMLTLLEGKGLRLTTYNEERQVVFTRTLQPQE